MGNRESDLTNRIRLHLAEKFPGLICWRNSVGYDDRTKVHYGIGGRGGADLIGIYRGRFVGIEVKSPGVYTEKERLENQSNFLRAIRDAGGVAGFASSVEEAEGIINGI